MSRGRILVVDDEKNARQGLEEILSEDGYEVATAIDGHRAIEQAREICPDLVLTDLKMPGMDGLELLSRIKGIDQDLPVIMITAFGTVKTAVQALKQGAEDYLTKPVDVEELEIIVKKAIERSQLLSEARALRERLREKYRFENVVGASPQMQEILQTVEQVAPSSATVLVLGETGTGKELIAEAIHQHSTRASGPFVKLNCTTLSENLLESELFGHEKGSFTGASNRRIGKFEVASGGTLFLDEIGDISPSTQVKLLRFLQEQKFERVGGNEVIEVDVRLVAATNRDLEKAIAEGKFRQDLFYRLNVISVRLPPLRERVSDIPLLVHHFMQKYSEKNRKKVLGIEPEAMQLLASYGWPGNIRELENVIERAVVLCQGETVGPRHLPTMFSKIESPAELGPLIPGSNMREIERYAIQKTLEHTGGNRTQAARILGISVRKLQYKLKEYSNARLVDESKSA
ncbi:MAG: sigma-54-dependent Fis family transcriptional regulator [Planctomycetes bacterium]|nr:sigma-54-dependent Fis family transcriptional regulator [Planctomycetota bacterium]